MANNLPPKTNVPVYSPSNFNYQASALTLATADERYAKKTDTATT